MVVVKMVMSKEIGERGVPHKGQGQPREGRYGRGWCFFFFVVGEISFFGAMRWCVLPFMVLLALH